MKKILVTGGCGYIGSHTIVKLIEQNQEVVIVDNLSNSSKVVLERIEKITGRKPLLIEGDVQDRDFLKSVFDSYEFDSVVHFAGLKAVGESVSQPVRYYQNNVNGSLMEQYGCYKIVFSSSATVYGDPQSVPIDETFPLSTTNPYGQSKLMVENILRDLSVASEHWRIAILRYFNPVAAHDSGLIGEHPNGIPNNLMPYIAQVGVGKLERLSVYGDDYKTPDGTGVRDYIHVVDLADAHVKALDALSVEHGCKAYNIGTGQGYSVLEMVAAFERASEQKIPYSIEPRRAGDIAECYADPRLSAELLGWTAKYDLDKMMEDQWRWQSNNPDGY